MPYVAEK